MCSDLLPGAARRILVYGVTGSGKTTLTGELGEVTGIAWHSVDDLTWEPGWVVVDQHEQRRRIDVICAQPEWILETAYGSWRHIPLARADLVVALDYPRWFSLQRLVRRTVARLVDRREICNGNRQTLRKALSRNGIIGWHFDSYARKHDRIREWYADPLGPAVVRLTSAAATQEWLRLVARANESHQTSPRRHDTNGRPGGPGAMLR